MVSGARRVNSAGEWAITQPLRDEVNLSLGIMARMTLAGHFEKWTGRVFVVNDLVDLSIARTRASSFHSGSTQVR